MKANPGKVNVASYSPGTLSHVLGLLLNKAAGIDLTHVGYKGSTPALTDVMGDHVPLMFDGIATSLPLIKGGKIKALRRQHAQRTPLLPDVPTFTELGYPQLEALAWMGLWARPTCPPPCSAAARRDAEGAGAAGGARARCTSSASTSALPRSVDEMTPGLRPTTSASARC